MGVSWMELSTFVAVIIISSKTPLLSVRIWVEDSWAVDTCTVPNSAAVTETVKSLELALMRNASYIFIKNAREEPS